jgi:hypothetical protein
VAQRISRLARLLGDREKPSEFLVPECVGYVHDKEPSRFGFVFKSLHVSPAPNGRLHPPPTPPTTLLELLSGGAPKPSLTTRIRIARTVATSIWYLHATNWLHKGLRSENAVWKPVYEVLGVEGGGGGPGAIKAAVVNERDANMLSPDSNAQLQLQFGERVVRVLDGIVV